RVNKLLLALKRDAPFQDYLKDPAVMRALRHWTGEERLPPEEAQSLTEDNYRVEAVFSRISALQAACHDAGISVPLNAVRTG
ncbi:unnamed protein product, partial [Phaeothamnion confervicola]